jgi:hypothetical protein
MNTSFWLLIASLVCAILATVGASVHPRLSLGWLAFACYIGSLLAGGRP